MTRFRLGLGQFPGGRGAASAVAKSAVALMALCLALGTSVAALGADQSKGATPTIASIQNVTSQVDYASPATPGQSGCIYPPAPWPPFCFDTDKATYKCEAGGSLQIGGTSKNPDGSMHYHMIGESNGDCTAPSSMDLTACLQTADYVEAQHVPLFWSGDQACQSIHGNSVQSLLMTAHWDFDVNCLGWVRLDIAVTGTLSTLYSHNATQTDPVQVGAAAC